MVARLFRLRVALLFSTFRARFVVVARRVIVALFAVAAAVGLAWIPSWIAGPVLESPFGRVSLEHAVIDTVIVSAVLVCAVLVPLFANARHLEPRQFAHLPARPASIAMAMLVTTPVSWPAMWLILWLVAFGYFRPDTRPVLWAAILGSLLIFVFAVCAARLTSALSKLTASGSAAGALRAVGLVLLIAILPVVVFAGTQMLTSPGAAATRDIAELLGWTPLGAAAAGMNLALAGDTNAALLRFGIVLAAIIVCVALWFPLVRYSVQHIPKPVDAAVAKTGLGWFERVSARPAPVIGARALSYWMRDPRYRIALAAVPIAPILMLAALWIAGMEVEALALIPLPVVLLLLGWSLHNDVAMDSTAIWSHIASGTRGRDDRIGRLFPILLIGLPLVLIGSSITVTVMGDWRMLPAVLGMNLGVLLTSCGVASVFSALAPYPATRPGDSPFAQPTVVGAGAGGAQTLSMLFAILLSIPPVWFALTGVNEESLSGNLLALAFGAGYGAIILLGGILLGGRIFDRAGPELIAITQTFD